jgi:ribose 5-phosphate isomerase RpiB
MNVNGTARQNTPSQIHPWPGRMPSATVERETASKTASMLGIGQDRPHPMVSSAVQALTRDGLAFRDFPLRTDQLPCQWARAVAECLAQGVCASGVLFCNDPGLVCCVANKVSGLRAVPVVTIAQAARATMSLAANLLVVEMPGRTFFEIRQILRLLAGSARVCPDGVACVLQELDGHAHR